jgi:hypothetical protein
VPRDDRNLRALVGRRRHLRVAVAARHKQRRLPRRQPGARGLLD